jgi:hypothetical protein
MRRRSEFSASWALAVLAMERRHGHDKTRKRWIGKMNRALAAAGQPAHTGTCVSCGWGGATWGAWVGGVLG